MGQQQLIFIVLSIIIVGIAIAISISLFRENAIVSKRDLLINECVSIGQLALKYYRMPANFGGGGNSFTGWQFPENLETSENGTFNVTINAENVVINGQGNEVVTGSDFIEVNVTVTANGFTTEIVH
ncbi:MAG: hypothetical protein AUK34_04705 [Ignavibacteria bacterium CG2_30_36_16]|nr:hypothetical protein [Ignavibacteria bacterium]OIP61687.1 MAG: hypothetical protein AUK34_04705 [Ignavibacteria bacterium CG2_30_36_16]PJB00324.1 MAG: hypothetical protein CO127_08635 [Ignavibacteria bacterium CG_4_9_14_3_um_filter_36_18]